MTDDDRTVDADTSTMDELRRMAADARSSARAPAPPEDSTVQADESTMEDLRRFAEEARRHAAPPAGAPAPTPFASPSDDRTVDADESTMAALRSYASEARQQNAAAAEPTTDIPPSSVEPQRVDDRTDRAVELPSLPDLRTPETNPRPRGVAAPDDHTVHRADAKPDLSTIRAPAVGSAGGAWRPPARMVMPTEPERSTPVHHGPWRTVSIVLGVVAVTLAAFVAFGFFTGGDDTSPDDSVPGESTPGAEEGDDGGG